MVGSLTGALRTVKVHLESSNNIKVYKVTDPWPLTHRAQKMTHKSAAPGLYGHSPVISTTTSTTSHTWSSPSCCCKSERGRGSPRPACPDNDERAAGKGGGGHQYQRPTIKPHFSLSPNTSLRELTSKKKKKKKVKEKNTECWWYEHLCEQEVQTGVKKGVPVTVWTRLQEGSKGRSAPLLTIVEEQLTPVCDSP